MPLKYPGPMRLTLLGFALCACAQPSPATPQWPSIVTIAGENAETYGYRDGVGTSALFAGPEGLALDEKRNRLYVADPANHVLRQVDLSTMEVHGPVRLVGP